MKTNLKKELTKQWFKNLQEIICSNVEELEKNKIFFKAKKWSRNTNKNDGGGEFRLLENGKIFDKVGVNFSEVYGKFSNDLKGKIPGTEKNSNFWASGISIVMHMKNPFVPAMHFNTRYIYTSHGWFGGGIDVTPCFKDEKLRRWFHKSLNKMCDRHNKKYYKNYSQWCDKYFSLPHRRETRGIGGIFFDYKKDNWEKNFHFVKDVGLEFMKIFNEIIETKNRIKWSKSEKEIQYLKRGRYVEFNLLYDRGTKFGLQTGGNIDAILMSLPPLAKWK
jgi:coproporphyrinogen III oxidase